MSKFSSAAKTGSTTDGVKCSSLLAMSVELSVCSEPSEKTAFSAEFSTWFPSEHLSSVRSRPLACHKFFIVVFLSCSMTPIILLSFGTFLLSSTSESFNSLSSVTWLCIFSEQERTSLFFKGDLR